MGEGDGRESGLVISLPADKMGRPDGWREGRKLLSKRVVVDTSAEGEACAGDLGNPPEATERGMAAGHHAAADIIHDGWAYFRGGGGGAGVREGTEQRVAFRAVVAGDGAAGGVGVESGGAVADGHEGVPEFLLTRRGQRAFHDRFDRGTGERLDGRGARFNGGFG